tara:strand:- start:261 stop:1610 length:1350 start_codon:yes stop_codon:yes gene_type:complete
MCLSSKTKAGPEAQVITAPQTGYSFVQPYAEDYSRRLLSSYFGSPGEYEGLISRPRDIPIEQTAGLTPLQIQARQQAGRLGEYQPYLTEAGRLFGRQERGLDEAFGFLPGARDAVTGGLGALQRAEETARGTTGIYDPSMAQNFFNPYEDQVVQQTLEDIGRQSAQADIGLRDQAVSAGAFGGSRGRITQEELARQTGRGAAEAVSGIRSAGFGQAQNQAQQAFEQQRGAQQGLASMQAGLGGQQAQLGQALGGLGQLSAGLSGQFGQIGGGLAGLGQQSQSQLGSQVNMLNQLGQQGQATQQAALSRQFAGANQLAGEPMQRLMQGQQLLAGMPTGQISGGTQGSAYQPQSYQKPSAFSQLLGAAGTAAGAYFGAQSDVDLKTNIKKVGELEPGVGWYTWDWNDKAKELHVDSEPTEGVLAQEVLEVRPDAVKVIDNGYYAVDYGKIL